MYEEDFVNEELVEFDVDGKKFSYKPVTGGEENGWLNECMDMDEKGRVIQDFSMLNKCKARNIKKVPYDKETIKKIIGVEKEWATLSEEQRWKLLSKLKTKTFDKIFSAIKDIDNPQDPKKKG